MCGIIAISSKNNCVPKILTGLKSLEYRGYDSTGIAFKINNNLYHVKSLGKISNLIEKSHEIVIKDKKNWKYLFEKKEKGKECNYVDGSIYICTTNFFKRYKSIYKKNKSFFYKVSNNFNIDIDYKHELVLAKYFLKENLRR